MHHPYINIAIEAATAAGKGVIRHFDRIEQVEREEKSKNDFVTEADLYAEQIIIKTIKAAYPNHGILAEESGQQNPHSDYQWIIDPIDGTYNFLHGMPHFCISIAVAIKGKLEHGLIFDPLRQEMFTATRGRGAYLNNKRIRVSTQRQLSDALIGTNLAHSDDPQAYQEYLKVFGACLPTCARMRGTGSAALDLAYVASGRFDGYWAHGLRAWDIAAGSLLILEAGGLAGDFSGGERHMESGNIVAATPKILKGLLQTLAPALPESWK